MKNEVAKERLTFEAGTAFHRDLSHATQGRKEVYTGNAFLSGEDTSSKKLIPSSHRILVKLTSKGYLRNGDTVSHRPISRHTTKKGRGQGEVCLSSEDITLLRPRPLTQHRKEGKVTGTMFISREDTSSFHATRQMREGDRERFDFL